MKLFAPITIRRQRSRPSGRIIVSRWYDARRWGLGFVRVTGSPGNLTIDGWSINLATGEIIKETQ